ncbi:MAG: PAS domain-containing protein [Spirochaetes bacterium]|nr:PAS domain-containing protein [Spirochaetota bacterium]
MKVKKENVLEELVRAGSLLSRELEFKSLISTLVDQSLDITKSDISCLYISKNPDIRTGYSLIHRRGKYPVPQELTAESTIVRFIAESCESVVFLKRREHIFQEVLLNNQMESGIALPIFTPKLKLGILVLNSQVPFFYNREKFKFLDSYTKLAGGMLHNSKMIQEIREYLKKIEELKRYQESIFSSMTNLLIATDPQGKIRYYNRAAEEKLELQKDDTGSELKELFRDRINETILGTVDEAGKTKTENLGIEGIYKSQKREMDFSLNIAPLKGARGRYQGLTLLFTDQTYERELQQKMKKVVEERRIIKDMFSRYLSQEVVKQLMESPDLVKPGGDKKEATIFFADIRGYTSFSEGKDPEYIIKILNEYFGEAVEIVVKHRGYIDKFIGDCIMAAWGVPMQTAEEDAYQAVSCALEIQELVASEKRSFFNGEASKLKVGIGMHTGPLVAGNLGSSRRMNYTVIGDTVNVAARLEGVAGPGEVIITENTRQFIGSRFILEQRKPVKVKGKTKPIPIYSVLKKAV